MLNTHQRQQKTKEKQNKGYDKEEKRVPKLIIRLGVKPAVIGSSDEENSINLKSNAKKAENAGSFITSIADKVKLRKRGQGNTSDAQLFKTISESSLPGKKRKKKNSSDFVSSSTIAPSVETDKAMLQSECNKIPIPSLTFEPRISKIITNNSHDYVQSSYLNSNSCSTFDDTFITNPSVSNYNLPSKKAKLSVHHPFINEKNPSVTSSLVDIHQLEVASYEEVSSVEHVHTSSVPVPPEYFGISDAADAPATSMLPRINSTSLPVNEEKSVLNTVKACTDSEDCRKDLKNGGVSLHDHDYLMTINKSLLEEIGVSNIELKNLDLSVVEEFFSHAKEISLVKKRTNDYVDKMMDLAIQIEKDQKCKEMPNKVNGLVNKDNSTVVLSTLKHSIQARDDQNITGLENRINSRDDAKILTKQLSRSSMSHDLSSKIHAKDNKNTHDNMGVSRQENHATKDKRKAMDGRCIVYVGNIPHAYSVSQLRERFKKFGVIKDIQIKSKVRCDFNSSDTHSLESEEMRNYGFITFSCNQEASDAIEGGNKNHKLQFHLSFGARRQFVGEEYKDLDGIVAKNENSIYKHNSRSSFLSQNKEEDDFDIILKNAMKARGVKPQPFRMKCKV